MVLQVHKENKVLLYQMVRARKKPLVVKVLQMGEDFEVETLEGWMHGKKGDWLVKGIEREFYCVKRRIFKKTYEVLDD